VCPREGREMKPLNELLAIPAVRDVLRRLTEAVAQAYADAGDNHKPEVGSSGRTYGTEVYEFCWFRIDESGLVKVTRREPYWFDLDDAMVACHRVGDSATDHIEECFPRDRSEWPTTLSRQGSFDFASQPGVTNNVLVLAHIGNPQEGLLQLHLGRPLVGEDGYLVRWAERAVIWTRDAGSALEAPEVVSSTEPLPAEEHKPAAKDKLKKKKGEKKGQGGDGDGQR